MTTRPKIGTVPYPPLTGENARPWADIEAFYRELNEGNAAFGPLEHIARTLAHSAFSQAGLSGVTSMHDLCIGPSKSILQNPHLRLSFDFEARTFWLTYVDGSQDPWTRQASPHDLFEVVAHFLTKRARWFTVPADQSGSDPASGA